MSITTDESKSTSRGDLVVRLGPQLRKQFKIAATLDDRTMSQALRRLVRRYVESMGATEIDAAGERNLD